MEAGPMVEDLDKYAPVLMLTEFHLPRLFGEFHLGEGCGRALLEGLPHRKLVGGGIEAFYLRPPRLDFFFGLFLRSVAAISEGILSKSKF